MSKEDIPRYFGSWKGRIIKAISIEGARTWEDIRENTGLYPTTLNRVLKELFDAKALRKLEKEDRTEYRVVKDLYEEYVKFFEDGGKDLKSVPIVKISEDKQNELLQWIDQWKTVKRLEQIDLKKRHFFLEGRFLDDFSKDVIANADSEVLVINPYVKPCDLTKTLEEPAKRGASVKIVARPPDESDKNAIENLQAAGVKVYSNKKVHGKIIVIDRALAIVSSMNFTVHSSAGQSWEGGMITVDRNIVEDIANSALRIIERPESTEKN